MIKREFVWKDGTRNYAIFSDCEKYRYVLERVWDDTKGKIMFIGLNPSTATEVKNDPTVSRMMSFAKRWNYGGLIVGNIFAFRTTFPSDLKKSVDPIGKETDKFLFENAKNSDKVVACWGNNAAFLHRGIQVRKLIEKMECFGLTKQEEPKHPLYLKSNSELKHLE
ncbi:DUF1643 domain-containing protein [Candidatus Pacearchaeota archaeon]|nr:DUF1643 domain-containing protein [Candidatus Pacearchaeota archaeon]